MPKKLGKKKKRSKVRYSGDDLPVDLIDGLIAGLGPEDVTGPDGLLQRLTGAIVSRMMEAELSEHLEYEAGEAPPDGQENRRNGHRTKKVRTGRGETEVSVPRDREGSFEPQVIPKHQRHFDGFDDKILSMYARGMSVREIRGHLEEIYGVKVSPDLISRATDAVVDELKSWRDRPLESVYPVVYLDALVVKVRDNGMVQKKSVYLVVGMDLEGQKSVLGMWMQKTEGAKFWLQILTELKQRGVEDIFILCADGLTGMAEAAEAAFPKTLFQTCIVHLIRSSTRLLAWKDRKAVCRELKALYTAASVDDAREKLDAFKEAWAHLPTVGNAWERRFDEWTPFLAFPDEVRRVIYTTNAIEALNRRVRKVLKTRGALPSDQAVEKLIYLAIRNGEKTWGAKTRDWSRARMAFAIHFGDRLPVV